MAIRDWPAGDGPRDKLLAHGAGILSDAELLAVVLRTGRRGASALDVARALLRRAGDLAGVLAMDAGSLVDEPGVGRGTYAQLQAGLELARRSVEQQLRQTDVMSSPRHTRRFLQHHLGARDREIFSCLFLDSQHRLLCCEDLFLGTLDGAAVYPREVAARALRHRAAAVILAHNHPSGIAEPSGADRRITERLRAGLALLDIRVLDHVIVGRGHAYSFAEEGLL